MLTRQWWILNVRPTSQTAKIKGHELVPGAAQRRPPAITAVTAEVAQFAGAPFGRRAGQVNSNHVLVKGAGAVYLSCWPDGSWRMRRIKSPQGADQLRMRTP